MNGRVDADVAGSEYTPQRRPLLGSQATPTTQSLRSDAPSSSDEEEGEINAPRPSYATGSSSSSSSSQNLGRGLDARESSSRGSVSLLDRIDRSRRAPPSHTSPSDRFHHSHPDRSSRLSQSSSWSERGGPASSSTYPAFGAGHDAYPRDGRGGYGRWREPRPLMHPSRHPSRSPYDGPNQGAYRRQADWSPTTRSPINRDTLRENERMRSTSTPDHHSVSDRERYGSRSTSAWDRSARDRPDRDPSKGNDTNRSWTREVEGDASVSAERERAISPYLSKRVKSPEATNVPVLEASESARAEQMSPPPPADRTSQAEGAERSMIAAETTSDESKRESGDALGSLSTEASLPVSREPETAEANADPIQSREATTIPETFAKESSAGKALQGELGISAAIQKDVIMSDEQLETGAGAPSSLADHRLTRQVFEDHARTARSPDASDAAAREVVQEASSEEDAKALEEASSPFEIKQDAQLPSQTTTEEAVGLPEGAAGDSGISPEQRSLNLSERPGLSKKDTEATDVHEVREGTLIRPQSPVPADAQLSSNKYVVTAALDEAQQPEVAFSTEEGRIGATSVIANDKTSAPLDILESLGSPAAGSEGQVFASLPALQVEDRPDLLAATKRPKSRASSYAKDRAAPDAAQVIARYIGQYGQHNGDDLLLEQIANANCKIAQLSTAPDRRPPFRDHILTSESSTRLMASRHKLSAFISRDKRVRQGKVDALRTQYRQLHAAWRSHCSRLDNVRELREAQRSRPALNTSVSTPVASTSMLAQHGGGQHLSAAEEASLGLLSNASMTRANRRNTQSTGLASFGDAVRSEAEFLEILASLENADMQDPSARAARTTAVEPKMQISSTDERVKRAYDDDEGFVANPVEFYFDTFDPDFWSDEEKTVFERRYALYPKQFGKIASALPQKTASQCVKYYYLTKKEDGHDYKALLASRGRDRRRKTRVKPKKGRGSALMADLKADEVEDDGSGMAEDLPPRRSGGRSRMLSALKGADGDAINEDGEAVESMLISRKRRVEEGDGEDARPARQRQPRRGKGERKARLVVDEMITSTDSAASDGKSSLRERNPTAQLAALASDSMPAREDGVDAKKRKRGAKAPAQAATGLAGESSVDVLATDEGGKRARNSTSSYWSVVERTEFLRSLATHGKDWDAIAKNLSTKSAAQARNFFVRNVEDGDLLEAAGLASANAKESLDTRMALANEYVERRSRALQVAAAAERAEPDMEHAVAQNDMEDVDGEVARTEIKHGLNISSLLNDVSNDARKPTVRQWFGKSDPSDDDTEDEEVPSLDRSSSAAAAAFLPPEHTRSSDHLQRRSQSFAADALEQTSGPSYAQPQSSLPSMSAFVHSDYRRDRAIPPLSYATASLREQSRPVRSYAEGRDLYGQLHASRDANMYSASPYSRSGPTVPSRTDPSSVTLRNGPESSWSRSAQPTPPSASYHTMPSQGSRSSSLAPPNLSPGGWRHSESRELYSRPQPSSSSLHHHQLHQDRQQQRDSPALYRTPLHSYERPSSSGDMGMPGQAPSSALRSLSPLPYPHSTRAPSYAHLSPGTTEQSRVQSPATQPQLYPRPAQPRYD